VPEPPEVLKVTAVPGVPVKVVLVMLNPDWAALVKTKLLVADIASW
jgi:hypothetical protein